MVVAKTKRNFLRRHVITSFFLLLVTLIVLCIPAYFIYEKVALELNRRAFTKARLAIDTAYSDITAQVGQPYSHQSKNTCSRGYVDAWEQVTSCSVDIDFIYKVSSLQESDNLDAKMVSIISKSKYLKTAPAPPSHIQVTLAPGATPDTSVHYYKAVGGMICIYRHVYGSDSGATSVAHLNLEPNDFYITFGCSELARNQYYPLAGN